MKSAANNREKHHQLKEESFHSLSITVSSFFYLTSIALITIFFLHLIVSFPKKSFLRQPHLLQNLIVCRGRSLRFIQRAVASGPQCVVVHKFQLPRDAKDEKLLAFLVLSESRYSISYFIIWSPFLVTATGIIGTRAFNIQLDRVDPKWAEQLPSIDYAVFSSSEWFLRQNYLYEDGHVIGCIYCNEPNMTAFKPARAIGMAFRSALRAVNSCKKIVSFVRTYTPSHYENGYWFSGGTCNRTRPIEREELNLALPDWGYRKMQVEEAEIAKSEGMGKGNKFEFLDVTEMMEMRVDGHPDRYWGFERGRDCLHWCLPGPVDTWNELLLQRIKELERIQKY